MRIPHPVILFDGECNLCRGSIRFIIKRDPRGIFHYASLSTPIAKELIESRGGSPGEFDSVTLVKDEHLHLHSDAVWRILERLQQPWPVAGAALRIIPRRLRNWGYNMIARHRTRWFGRSDRCMIMPEEWRSRFLDEPESSPVVCE